MIREVEKNKNTTEITYYFESMNDYIKHMKKIKDTASNLPERLCFSKHNTTSNHSYFTEFFETKTFQEFLHHLDHGKKEYDIDKDVFKTKEYEQKFKSERDYYGNPNVPRALMGLPKNCHRIRKTKQTDYYHIFIGFSEASYISPESIKEYKLKIFEKINGLISEGHAVDISLFARTYFEKIDTYVNIIISLVKGNVAVDMNKLMFFVTTVDVLRRGYFRLMEVDPLIFNEEDNYQYGVNMSSKTDEIEKIFNSILIHPLSSFELNNDEDSAENRLRVAMEDVENRLGIMGKF